MSNLLKYIYKQLQYIVKLAQSNHFSSFYHIKICNKLLKAVFKALFTFLVESAVRILPIMAKKVVFRAKFDLGYERNIFKLNHL